jgi:hypothetical protein
VGKGDLDSVRFRIFDCVGRECPPVESVFGMSCNIGWYWCPEI